MRLVGGVFVEFLGAVAAWGFPYVIEAYLSVVALVGCLMEQKGNHQYGVVGPPG